MLEKMGMMQKGAMIRNACFKVYEEGKHVTGDVGGRATTTEFAKAVIGNME